ncbi:MAG: selenium metabolism-associated LysR family transcriptional regulator [Oscillospiraceae bacterium]|nr:selenium metabolism-associated LysR family transcriptional regulator [Oscillospiraceae bacterium]
MDFKQIEAYVKVVEFASFSKAAEAIFLSQPSVSIYVSALEKELGQALINRTTKGVSPTLAGKIFYENAKEILALKHNTIERIRNLAGNLSGEISILASTVPSQYILPEILARFSKIYPDISFNVRQGDTLKVSRGIAAQEAEIGFSGGIIESDKCSFREFMSEEIIFIAPYQKEFLEPREHSLEELLYKHPFVSRESGSGTKSEYENFFASQGVDLSQVNSSASFDNTQSIINAVISGLGVSVVSEFAARAFIAQNMIVPLKLKAKLPQRKFCYVLKKNFSHSHLVDLFVEFLNAK